MKMGNFVEAKCYFEKVLFHEPENLSALLIWVRRRSIGDNNSAVETFLSAFSVDRSNRVVLYKLANNIQKSKSMKRTNLNDAIIEILEQKTLVNPPVIASNAIKLLRMIISANYLKNFLTSS